MPRSSIPFFKAFPPIAFFLLLLIYGLFVHPVLVGGKMLPLEVLTLLAICFSCLYIMRLGYNWSDLQTSMSSKVGQALPVLLILFAIGVLIGSWIVSGTIPMLIYHGVAWINPAWIYIVAFLICIVFSLLTGTSWGSAGTIGVVMMGIAQVYDANLAITAAAVVGGSFFGDKLSPLSDTTNIASLATDVPLYEHIKSMLYTTGPSAVLAALVYMAISPSSFGETASELAVISQTRSDLHQIFNFNAMLLLPLAVVIYGSIRKKSTFLTLMLSAFLAMIMALIFQDFAFQDVVSCLKDGFKPSMAGQEVAADSSIVKILNRGGLYNLIEGIVISILIFAFIGTLDVIDAIAVSIRAIMSKIQKPRQLVTASLTATWLTNLTTSNQYATSFVIGTAFKKKYDDMKVNRSVLSRSIEDAGTMMENLAPWTPSGIFMASTLGVSALEYAPYQFLSLFNILLAYFFAMTGIAVFKTSAKK